MAFTYSYGELASDLGTNTADGLRNVANTAANFVCDAYQNYAAATTGFPDPTGIGAFNNALFSRMCSPRGKTPAAPTQPFTGGQCATRYHVSYSYTDPVTGPGSGTIFNVLGPITGITRGKSGTSYGIGAQGQPDGTSRPDGIAYFVLGSQTVINRRKYSITGVVRADGGTDNCGNPSPQFPDTGLPDSAVTNNNTSVNIGAGLIVNVPVFYTPITVDANAYIDAQVQVKVGPFNVTFDLGGVTIQPTFNAPTGGSQSPSTPYLPPGAPSSQPRNTGNDPAGKQVAPCDLSTVISKLNTLQSTSDDIKNCSCPITYTPQTTSLGSGVAGYSALPTNTIKVNLSITSTPANAKTQKSNGSEPTSYFCGYYYWGDGTGRTERIAISKLQSVFFKPDWATAFGWDLYLGYSCSVSATSLSPSKPGGTLAGLQMKAPPA